MKLLSQIYSAIQERLFPFLDEMIGPLGEKEKQLAQTLELLRLDPFIRDTWRGPGRPPRNRRKMARAFVAKAVYNFSTTKQLLGVLKGNPELRRLCASARPGQGDGAPDVRGAGADRGSTAAFGTVKPTEERTKVSREGRGLSASGLKTLPQEKNLVGGDRTDLILLLLSSPTGKRVSYFRFYLNFAIGSVS